MPKAKKKTSEKLVREHVEHAVKTHAENMAHQTSAPVKAKRGRKVS